MNSRQNILTYGVAMAAFLFVLKWLGTRLIIINYAFEIYIGSIAILFTAFGMWLALKLARPKTVVVEKEVYVNPLQDFQVNADALERYGISQRELQVLELVAAGLSNKEIGEQLFISLDTVKSHTKNIFGKLEVQRRTQAIQKAKEAGLIPL